MDSYDTPRDSSGGRPHGKRKAALHVQGSHKKAKSSTSTRSTASAASSTASVHSGNPVSVPKVPPATVTNQTVYMGYGPLQAGVLPASSAAPPTNLSSLTSRANSSGIRLGGQRDQAHGVLQVLPSAGSNPTASPPIGPQSDDATPLAKYISASSSTNRPLSQPKSGAPTTLVILPHSSGSRSSRSSNRGHRPSHLQNSVPSAVFGPVSSPTKHLSIHSVPVVDQPARQPTKQPTSYLMRQGGPPVGVSSPAASQPTTKPSSHSSIQQIMGHGNPPGRSSGIGGPGGGGAVSSIPPFGGPQGAPPQSSVIQPARYPGIELQPKARPITLSQLVNEVKGIYVGLAMVETKCIEVDNEQSANNNPLEDNQWQALLVLHRTLLHEHHDFMLASQHPSASPALRRVAQKYAMPARMWNHGIHSFLELLRHRLPASREHMITFIYMAYSIIAVLYESVRAFEDTWVECLGDLSRYRMAIEDDNQHVRDTWTVLSRRWYSLASDRAPTTGRLHHHLAILARPCVITEMYHFVKSLCVPIPFTSTRESIMTLLDPVLNDTKRHVPPVELSFVKAHAILFTKLDQKATKFEDIVSHLLNNLAHITPKEEGAWTQTGVYMAIINSCALLNYGGDLNILMKVLRDDIHRSATEGDDGARPVPSADKPATLPARDTVTTDSANLWATPAPLSRGRRDEVPAVVDPEILKEMESVQKLVTEIDKAVFARVGDACHGYIHARLVWMLCMARLPEGRIYVDHGFPWQELVKTLNKMMRTCENIERVEQDVFMQPQVDRKAEEERKIRDIQFRQQQQQQARDKAGDNRLFVPTEPPNVEIPMPPPARSDEDKPLPDDWFLRGLLWSEYIFPQGWFANMESIDDDERLMESDSTSKNRKKRVLWMACRLAQYKTWITYNATTHEFQVTEAFLHVDEQKEAEKPTGSDLEDNKVQAGVVGYEADENSAGDTTLDLR